VSEHGRRPAPRDGGQGAPDRSGQRRVALGGALRRAWVGYQRRLDQEMAAAGFPDRGFPDGRVLRLAARSDQVTAAEIGRELGITRQGAGKIVADLRDRGYVTLGSSPSDARQKVITLTPRARDYLAAQRAAARRIEQELRDRVGAEAYQSLFALLDALGGEEDQLRMRDYLRHALRLADDPERM
jgi:DNA-binding MarR family transcriptional regulator